MIEIVITEVVNAYGGRGHQSLDELKRAVKLAMAVCSKATGIDWSEEDYFYILGSVVSKLDGLDKKKHC